MSRCSHSKGQARDPADGRESYERTMRALSGIKEAWRCVRSCRGERAHKGVQHIPRGPPQRTCAGKTIRQGPQAAKGLSTSPDWTWHGKSIPASSSVTTAPFFRWRHEKSQCREQKAERTHRDCPYTLTIMRSRVSGVWSRPCCRFAFVSSTIDWRSCCSLIPRENISSLLCDV